MPKFGERLRELRTAKGLSQLEFSKQVKVSKSSVNMYERGEREPNFETLERIADYFNVDMDYLLGKTDVVNKSQQFISALRAPATDLTNEENDLIFKFRALDDRGKAAVLTILNHEYESQTSQTGENANTSAKEA